MPIPTKEIENFVRKEALKLTHATHNYGHFRRVADGAVWFVKVLGGSRREQELAYIAGLIHDIVRPADERVDHAIASAERARKILVQFGMKGNDVDDIVQAVRDHRLQPAKWETPLHQSVYLADKIFEQMGAYLLFRRCMYVAESETYRDVPMEKAITEHFAMRIERIPKNAFPARFSKLVEYQYGWIEDAQKALSGKEGWAWEIARASYNAGRAGEAGLEELILTFEPSSPEAARYKKETLDYLEGKKLNVFESLV